MIAVHHDEDAQSPRQDDNFGTMVCFHRNYNLGDEHKHENADDFLLSLLEDTINKDDGDWYKAERFRERVQDSFNPQELGWSAYDRAVDNKLLEAISRKHVIMPLYLYDHSGLSISTGSFTGRAHHADWDSGQVGWIYATKEDVLREFGGKNLTAAKREQAETLMRGEVDYYDNYLRGECYGYELYKGGDVVDSCWGFIGDFDGVLEAIESYLPDECTGITSDLQEQSEKVSVLAFLKEASAQIAAAPAPPIERQASLDAGAR